MRNPLTFKVTKSYQYTDINTGRMVQGGVIYEVECAWRAMYQILNLRDPDWNKNQADTYFWTFPIPIGEGLELRYFLEIEAPTERHKRYYRIARQLSMTC